MDDPEFLRILNDRKYTHLKPYELPLGESLLDVTKRTLSCWNERIAVSQKQNANVICVAHESNLKGLIIFLDKLCHMTLVTFL
jgi:bisphosphoglycerate-dependent phosphoglycerate mutase